jgi:hypothetical protein
MADEFAVVRHIHAADPQRPAGPEAMYVFADTNA